MVAQKLPSTRQFKLWNWRGLFALFLLVIIFLSFVGIIQVQHHVRHLETQYAQALNKQVQLREESGKLKLEKHHLTALARVESIARESLKMSFIGSLETPATPSNSSQKKPTVNSYTLFLEKHNESFQP